MRRKLTMIALAGVLAVAATACSKAATGTSDGGQGNQAQSPTSGAANANNGYGNGYSSGGSGGGQSTGNASAISIQGFKFGSGSIKVKVGSKLTWTNADQVPHTVTADNGTFNHQLDPGASWQLVFPTAGKYTYHCTIHPRMKGTVWVS